MLKIDPPLPYNISMIKAQNIASIKLSNIKNKTTSIRPVMYGGNKNTDKKISVFENNLYISFCF